MWKKSDRKCKVMLFTLFPSSLSVALLQVLRPHARPRVLTIQAVLCYFDKRALFGAKAFMTGSLFTTNKQLKILLLH